MIKKREVGSRVDMRVGKDQAGRWWWESTDEPGTLHGPFRTSAEADEDFRVSVLGQQVTVLPQEGEKI